MGGVNWRGLAVGTGSGPWRQVHVVSHSICQRSDCIAIGAASGAAGPSSPVHRYSSVSGLYGTANLGP